MEPVYFITLILVPVSLIWANISLRYILYYQSQIYRQEGKPEVNRRIIRVAKISMLVSSLAFLGSTVYLFTMVNAISPPSMTIPATSEEGKEELSPTGSPIPQVVFTPSPQSTPTPEQTAVTGFARIGNTNGFGVNVRSAPGLANEMVTQLSDGSRVELTGEEESADGFTWIRVRMEGGLVGWIAENFLILER